MDQKPKLAGKTWLRIRRMLEEAEVPFVVREEIMGLVQHYGQQRKAEARLNPATPE